MIRETARVLVRDELDRVLLIRSADPRALSRQAWWLPGGGIEQGEDPRATAEREMEEETGFVPTDLVLVGFHNIWMTYRRREWLQRETIFAARVGVAVTTPTGPTGLDFAVHLEHHWWTRSELICTAELVLPRRLLDVLDHVVRQARDPLMIRDDLRIVVRPD